MTDTPSKDAAAVALGRKGGLARSQAKAEAARRNGLKGGSRKPVEPQAEPAAVETPRPRRTAQAVRPAAKRLDPAPQAVRAVASVEALVEAIYRRLSFQEQVRLAKYGAAPTLQRQLLADHGERAGAIRDELQRVARIRTGVEA